MLSEVAGDVFGSRPKRRDRGAARPTPRAVVAGKMSLFQLSRCNCGKKAWDSKGASDCASLGGLRRRAVSEAHTVELEFEFEFEFEFKD